MQQRTNGEVMRKPDGRVKVIKKPWGKWVPNGSSDATNDIAAIRRWFDAGGPSEGLPGIGVACRGSQIAILDLDLSDGVSAEELLQRCEELVGEPLPDTAMVRTGSGGLHIWFRDEMEEVPQGTNLLKNAVLPGNRQLIGVDTRSARGNGFIVAPPSFYPLDDGETVQYEWVKSTDLADASWLLKLLSAGGQKKSAASLPQRDYSQTNFTRSTVTEPPPLLPNALAFFDPDVRDDWFRVGVALYDVPGGWVLFEQWCAPHANARAAHRCAPQVLAELAPREDGGRPVAATFYDAVKSPSQSTGAASTVDSLMREAFRRQATASAGAKLEEEQQKAKALAAFMVPKPLWAEGADPHFDERPVLIYRDQGKNGRDPFAPHPLPLMHLGISAMLSGVGGGGKTHLAARLAVCVVAGGEWLREQDSVDADPRASKATYGWFVDESMAGGVLWIGAEESDIEMGRRIWKACRFNADGSEANEAEKIRRRDLVAKRLRVVALQDTPAEGERLVRTVTKRTQDETWTETKRLELWLRVKAAIDAPAPDGSPWRLIILDPMVELIASGAENDSDAMAEALRHGVHALRQGTSATILVLHHNRKGGAGDGDDADAARGSSAIMGSMRWAAAISKSKDGWVCVKVTKSNYTKKDTMVLQKWPDDGDAWLSPVTAGDFARVEDAKENSKGDAKKNGEKKNSKSQGPPPPARPPGKVPPDVEW
jgi:hypothetical protein